MAQVTGRVVKPHGGSAADMAQVRARFRLVDDAGREVTQAWDTNADRVIIGDVDIEIASSDGDYSVTLPANTHIEPQGTRWARIMVMRGNEGPTRSLIVPVGDETYDEHEILADAVEPLPTPEPMNLVDYAERTSQLVTASLNFLTYADVTGLVITVPDLEDYVLLRAGAPIKHAAANANMGLAIAPTSADAISEWRDIAYSVHGAIGQVSSPRAEYLLSPHSAGDYKVMVYTFTTGVVTVDASATQKAYIYGLRV